MTPSISNEDKHYRKLWTVERNNSVHRFRVGDFQIQNSWAKSQERHCAYCTHWMWQLRWPLRISLSSLSLQWRQHRGCRICQLARQCHNVGTSYSSWDRAYPWHETWFQIMGWRYWYLEVRTSRALRTGLYFLQVNYNALVFLQAFLLWTRGTSRRNWKLHHELWVPQAVNMVKMQ